MATEYEYQSEQTQTDFEKGNLKIRPRETNKSFVLIFEGEWNEIVPVERIKTFFNEITRFEEIRQFPDMHFDFRKLKAVYTDGIQLILHFISELLRLEQVNPFLLTVYYESSNEWQNSVFSMLKPSFDSKHELKALPTSLENNQYNEEPKKPVSDAEAQSSKPSIFLLSGLSSDLSDDLAYHLLSRGAAVVTRNTREELEEYIKKDHAIAVILDPLGIYGMNTEDILPWLSSIYKKVSSHFFIITKVLDQKVSSDLQKRAKFLRSESDLEKMFGKVMASIWNAELIKRQVRRHVRVPVIKKDTILIQPLSSSDEGEDTMQGTVLNISMGGIFAQLTEPTMKHWFDNQKPSYPIELRIRHKILKPHVITVMQKDTYIALKFHRIADHEKLSLAHYILECMDSNFS